MLIFKSLLSALMMFDPSKDLMMSLLMVMCYMSSLFILSSGLVSALLNKMTSKTAEHPTATVLSTIRVSARAINLRINFLMGVKFQRKV
jgi:hypothetical protein